MISASNSTETALVLIDFQKGFESPFWGTRNNPDAERNALALLSAFRQDDQLVFHVRHRSTEVGSPLSGAGAALKDGFQPQDGGRLIEKSVNSAFIGTSLEDDLRARGITHLVICGLTTPHCVSTTARMAANLGFQVTLAGDACAAFSRHSDATFDGGPMPSADEVHRSALHHLHGEFAHVETTHDILALLSKIS